MKRGRPMPLRIEFTAGDALRFWEKVDEVDGCWVWTATRNSAGYGHFGWAHDVWLAHRVSYWLAHGHVPLDLTLDHLCRNRACVNPAHLEAVPDRVNLLRGEGGSARNARKTHCHNGHEFCPETTYVTRKGARVCLPCRQVWYAQRRSA